MIDNGIKCARVTVTPYAVGGGDCISPASLGCKSILEFLESFISSKQRTCCPTSFNPKWAALKKEYYSNLSSAHSLGKQGCHSQQRIAMVVQNKQFIHVFYHK